MAVIEYTLTDPACPATADAPLADLAAGPGAGSGHGLVCVYHERWEIELAIDERFIAPTADLSALDACIDIRIIL